MRISDWSSDVCSSDLLDPSRPAAQEWPPCRKRRGRMTERVDCVVIGAGVVGLAVARRLAMAGREVIVLESADMIGTGTSSRNSEVIHAGIYYPTGSFKARACVAGKHALYDYCRSEEHTSELQSLMRISYAVFCL